MIDHGATIPDVVTANMPKELADMSHPERMAALMRELSSPTSVATAVRLLEQIKLEFLDAQEGYKMAARRHGASEPPPSMPPVEMATVETPPKPDPKPPVLVAETPDPTPAPAGTPPAVPEPVVPEMPLGDSKGISILDNLALAYLTDERSPIHSIRHATRSNYQSLLKRVRDDCGHWLLSETTIEDFEAKYREWTGGGKKIATGNSLMTMVRNLTTFGATVLADVHCERLSGSLRRFKFEKYQKRSVGRLTKEHADLVRAMAHKKGFHSIAAAQAFQFDCKFMQKDVIGEYVPMSEPVPSDVIVDDVKWIRGLRWNEIRGDVLSHQTIFGELTKINLKNTPMVAEEVARIPEHKRAGPIIVCETSGKPWTAVSFRRMWRKLATEAGVPPDVKNMDTRVREDEGDDEMATEEAR